METVAPLTLEPASLSATGSGSWSFPLRLAFRFVFCYFLLYVAPESGRVSLVGLLEVGQNLISNVYTRLWHALVPWVATRVFHLSGKAVTYFPTGSGDTTLAYIENLCYLVIAVVATVIWSILDRNRKEYRQLYFWFHILIRYTLAITMLSYGFAKVFPLQFRAPGLSTLLETYGEFSPMGVLWNFMGASTAYTIFTGTLEVLGGTLLFFRRTTLLGALLSAMVLVNIVALNFCYDVPVKLYSFNLLVMAILLLAPDFRRIYNVLYLHRAAEAVDLGALPFQRKWMRIAAVSVKALVILAILGSQIIGGWKMYQNMTATNHPPLYGIWDVEKFTQNGQDLLPLLTDTVRWRKMVVQSPQFLSFRRMNDSPAGYRTEYSPAKHTVAVWTQLNEKKKDTLSYTFPDPNHLVLEGILQNSPVVIRLRKVDHTKFLLVSRGFHWITETPFNR